MWWQGGVVVERGMGLPIGSQLQRRVGLAKSLDLTQLHGVGCGAVGSKGIARLMEMGMSMAGGQI